MRRLLIELLLLKLGVVFRIILWSQEGSEEGYEVFMSNIREWVMVDHCA